MVRAFCVSCSPFMLVRQHWSSPVSHIEQGHRTPLTSRALHQLPPGVRRGTALAGDQQGTCSRAKARRGAPARSGRCAGRCSNTPHRVPVENHPRAHGTLAPHLGCFPPGCSAGLVGRPSETPAGARSEGAFGALGATVSLPGGMDGLAAHPYSARSVTGHHRDPVALQPGP